MIANDIIFQTKLSGPKKGFFTEFSFSQSAAQVDKKIFITQESLSLINNFSVLKLNNYFKKLFSFFKCKKKWK